MNTVEQQAEQFVSAHVGEVEPLMREEALEEWEAAATGAPEHDERVAALRARLMRVYADEGRFARVRELHQANGIANPLLARETQLLFYSFSKGQQDEKTIDQIAQLQKEAESTFNTFRGVFEGKPLSDNEIATILMTETDSARLKGVWEASKQIGERVADKVIALARLRNDAARRAGYANHFSKNLTLNEIDEERLFKILGELEALTTEPFRQAKGELDALLAERYGVAVAELRPWHYHDPFFQRPPRVGAVNVDRFFAGRSLEEIAIRGYDGIGMDVRAILARSDLYARPNKYQHAFCTDIDREGDVRVMCNLVSDERWMETLLHELGHGVYDQYLDPDLPFLLRRPAHTLSTEAIAMLMGRLALNPEWLVEVAGAPAAEVAEVAPHLKARQRLGMLIFVRWVLVVTNFERALYQNPEQDLNTLWWDLVERYQMVPRPEGRQAPDWAAKIHLALYPVYYQNYMLGELMASQLNRTIAQRFGRLINTPAAGQFLINELFRRGARADWDTTLAQVTGEPLSARYFAEDFV
ncbi:MAG TPA: M2 family metallopeptidase [Chloroflexota bacterium]|nr:M2 family metallopeptidase [Chloroflexota bacterium]